MSSSADGTAVCGCRGIRTCLVCEISKTIATVKNVTATDEELYQCYRCGQILSGDFAVAQKPLRECTDRTKCPPRSCLYMHEQMALGRREGSNFSGVTVVKEFITESEEESLIHQMDSLQWAESQSGRKKQDYGPKVNFKKRKVRVGTFSGLPPFSRELVTRLSDLELLKGFYPVELCNLDYNSSRGSAIEPHQDDSWIWGERLVTVNLLSPTYLSFNHPTLSLTVHIPLPPRSLVIVMGIARHVWSHSIRRENIIGRRVAMTMRELDNGFLEGHQDEQIGGELMRIAQCFKGTPINFN